MPIAAPRFPGLRAGQLNELVRIQKRTDVKDSSGGTEPKWIDVPSGVVWASIRPLISGRGGEIISAEVLRAIKMLRITIRYRTDITEQHRLLQINREDAGAKERPLNILSVNDPDGNRRQLTLICEAGLVSG